MFCFDKLKREIECGKEPQVHSSTGAPAALKESSCLFAREWALPLDEDVPLSVPLRVNPIGLANHLAKGLSLRKMRFFSPH